MKSSHILQGLRSGTLGGLALLAGIACAGARGQSLNPAALQPHATPTAVVTPKSSALLQLRQVLDSGVSVPYISGVPLQPGPYAAVGPGEDIIVYGHDFATADGKSGQVMLNLVPYSNPLFNRYTPGHTSAQTVSYPLEIPPAGWTDTSIKATIPNNIVGVPDQYTKLQVVRSDGVKSNAMTVPFLALREIAFLPPSDVQASCSQVADENECNNFSSFPIPLRPNLSVVAAHINVVSSQTNGVDSWSFNLKNGWAADDLDGALRDLYDQGSADGDLSVVGRDWMYNTPPTPPSLECCATAWGWNNLPTAVSFVIHFWCASQEVYGFNIQILGPKGVPWK